MQSTSRIAAAASILGTLAFASPALAQEDHASCGDGARSYVVAAAQSGQAGEIASEQAMAGTINEGVHEAHAALCDPKP